MVRGKFAGLGFDPAPGNAGDVLAAADAMTGAGDRLAGSSGSLRAVLTRGGWQGVAADGFASAGGAVPATLDAARTELAGASKALRTWHARLKANQHAAERLDATARRLRHELGEAERDVLAADARSAPGAELQAAQHHLAAVRARLASTLRAAHRLARRHRREADTAASAVRGGAWPSGWPGAGVATDAGGTSAWTGQVATITLPGETDPVVALPIGAQPGDPDWPALGLPTGTRFGDLDWPPPTADPVGRDLTGAPTVPADLPAPIPEVTDPAGTTATATDPLAIPQPTGAADPVGPRFGGVAAPLPQPTDAAATGDHPARQPAAAQVITTPAPPSTPRPPGSAEPVQPAPLSTGRDHSHTGTSRPERCQSAHGRSEHHASSPLGRHQSGQAGQDQSGHGQPGHAQSAHAHTGHGHTGHGQPGHAHTWHGTAEHGTAEHGTAEHAHTGHAHTGHHTAGHAHTGHGNAGHGNAGHGNAGHGNAGHGNAGHGNAGHGNAGHGNAGHGNAGHGKRRARPLRRPARRTRPHRIRPVRQPPDQCGVLGARRPTSARAVRRPPDPGAAQPRPGDRQRRRRDHRRNGCTQPRLRDRRK